MGGLFAPAGTPIRVTQRLTAELARVMRDPEVLQAVKDAGALPFTLAREEFASLVRSDLALSASGALARHAI